MLLTETSLGSFDVKSGTLIVSDPCYDMDQWCSNALKNCRKGRWHGRVVYSDEGIWGNRVKELIAHARGFSQRNPEYEAPFTVGVDSGQAGIFEALTYRQDLAVGDDFEYQHSESPLVSENEDGAKWYNACCDRTLADGEAGVVPDGVVASSGYGDGVYGCYVSKHKGEIVAIKVVFITFPE